MTLGFYPAGVLEHMLAGDGSELQPTPSALIVLVVRLAATTRHRQRQFREHWYNYLAG